MSRTIPALVDDETIMFRTRTGGRVVVGIDADSSDSPSLQCYESVCEACQAADRGDHVGLSSATGWARVHAGECTALPAHYVDAEAEALEQAEEAAELLTTIQRGATADPALLLARAEAHTRLAAVFAAVARSRAVDGA